MASDPIHQQRLTFFGGGKMAAAIVDGLVHAGTEQSGVGEIEVIVRRESSAQTWEDRFPTVKTTLVTAEDRLAKSGDGPIVLAVKPHQIEGIVAQHQCWADRCVISVAAGVSVEALSRWLGNDRVVRVMPNTPSMVGEGAAGVVFGDGATEEDRSMVMRIFECVGLAVEIEEKQMHALIGVAGSAPAYICMMIEAMADGGVATGLPRKLAMQLAAQTVLGTAKMVAESGIHPGELKDAVASPGGTTIEAIASLEQNGFRGAVIGAVQSAASHSIEMTKLTK